MCTEGKVIRKYEAETKSLNIKYDEYAYKVMQQDPEVPITYNPGAS